VARLRHIFVCATPGEGRCGAKGGGDLLEAFRAEVERRGLSPAAVLRNTCTRRHHEGPVVFVYPDDVWYTFLGSIRRRCTPAEAPALALDGSFLGVNRSLSAA
jgi:hypothetical protein